jgi:hypothetical protein
MTQSKTKIMTSWGYLAVSGCYVGTIAFSITFGAASATFKAWYGAEEHELGPAIPRTWLNADCIIWNA